MKNLKTSSAAEATADAGISIETRIRKVILTATAMMAIGWATGILG